MFNCVALLERSLRPGQFNSVMGGHGRQRGSERFQVLAGDAGRGYNRAMICPNDRTEMHPVQVASHYGQTILLEQCAGCGGIWFDEAELFRTRQGEARRIEHLDAGMLRAPSQITSAELHCPRDGAALFRFTDKHFPDSIILERCPSCRGVWLNRGDFTRYQEVRQARLTQPKEIIIGDDGLQEGVAGVLAAPGGGSSDSVLGRLGSFLSTPLDERTLRPMNPDKSGAAGEESGAPAENGIGAALNVVMLLLRLFVR
jgi:Zn-finger nucleic acid-binding protein